jgi:hypothetical protein
MGDASGEMWGNLEISGALGIMSEFEISAFRPALKKGTEGS